MTLHRLDVVRVAFTLFSFDPKAIKNLRDLPSDRKVGAEKGLTTPVVFSKEQTPGLVIRLCPATFAKTSIALSSLHKHNLEWKIPCP